MLFKIDLREDEETYYKYEDFESLAHAKEVALQRAVDAFTREDIYIIDARGFIITESLWSDSLEPVEFDGEPINPAYVLCTVGKGYYQIWSDELEEIERKLMEAYY